MKHIKSFMYTPTEIQFAHEIAEKLHNPGALSQFLRFTQEVPHDILRGFLHDACAVSADKVRVSRAAIFVNSVNQYKRYGNGYPGH